MASAFDIGGSGEVPVRSQSEVLREEDKRHIVGSHRAATAATVIMLVLGTGVGLSSVSPWYGAGASAATVGVSTVLWLVVAFPEEAIVRRLGDPNPKKAKLTTSNSYPISFPPVFENKPEIGVDAK